MNHERGIDILKHNFGTSYKTMNKMLRILNYEYSRIFQTVKEEHEVVSKNSDSVRSTCFSGLWHGVAMDQDKTPFMYF